ncbi:MAG: hypothetical protein ACOYMA_17405, partial [Bacteroidia bacterium]
MKRITFFMAAMAVSFASYAVDMTGTYTVGTAGTYTTLKAAVDALNASTITGNVVFEIVSDISETAPIGLLAANGSYTITIKPAAAITPTLTFSGCNATAGATQYSGFAISGTSYVIIDGSNTVDGTTKDMTFKMNDGTNGRILVQLFGNCDNVTIKNLVIAYQAPMSTATTTRGIYLNGQSTGACDNFTVENCSIGDATNTPYYAVGITGYGTAPKIYSTNNLIKNNILFGRIRPIYLYVAGTASTSNEISNNTVSTFGGSNGTTTYTIFWNDWAGTLNIKNNKIPVLNVANSSGTSGVYGISGLTAAVGSIVNVHNNFVGGTNTSTGVAIPSVFALMYIQDNATYNVFNNTFYYQSLTNAGEKSNIHISGSTCTVNLKNNIIFNNSDNATAYCVWKSNGTLNSDYNDLYVSGALANIGYLATAKKALSDWQIAFTPNNDLNSKSVTVNFVDVATGDLRITGASEHDDHLAVPRQADVLTDKLGTTRAAYTYAGAHEAAMPFYWTTVATPEVTARIMKTSSGIEVELDGEANIELYTINGVLIEKTKTSGSYSR